MGPGGGRRAAGSDRAFPWQRGGAIFGTFPCEKWSAFTRPLERRDTASAGGARGGGASREGETGRGRGSEAARSGGAKRGEATGRAGVRKARGV